MKMYDSVIRFD